MMINGQLIKKIKIIIYKIDWKTKTFYFVKLHKEFI